jgi:ornithine cyclodeaminase/alanine dehydrogenase-like protein (mu-crystallin family)
VIGSGVQARSHIRVFRETFGPAPVRLWSPTRANAEAAAAETGADLAESAEAACAGADLVIAASSSAEPVVRDAWVPRARWWSASARRSSNGASWTTP